MTFYQSYPFLATLVNAGRTLTYHPGMSELVQGSVTANIFFFQILFHVNNEIRKGKDPHAPFYKFLSPCNHEDCRQGDTWEDELNFSYRQMATALTKFATKIEKGMSKFEILDQIRLESQIIYWTDSNRVTWWLVNWELINFLTEAHARGELQAVLAQGGKLSERKLLGNLHNANYLVTDKSEITSSLYEMNNIDDHRTSAKNLKALTNGQNKKEKKREPENRFKGVSPREMINHTLPTRSRAQDAINSKQETIRKLIEERTCAADFIAWRGQQLAMTPAYQGQTVTERVVLHFYAKKLTRINEKQSLADVIEMLEADIERCPIKKQQEQAQEKAKTEDQTNDRFQRLYAFYQKDKEQAFEWARKNHQWNAFRDWMVANGLAV